MKLERCWTNAAPSEADATKQSPSLVLSLSQETRSLVLGIPFLGSVSDAMISPTAPPSSPLIPCNRPELPGAPASRGLLHASAVTWLPQAALPSQEWTKVNIQSVSYILICFQYICGALPLLTVHLQVCKRNEDRASGPSECAGVRRASCLPTAYQLADTKVGLSWVWSTR